MEYSLLKAGGEKETLNISLAGEAVGDGEKELHKSAWLMKSGQSGEARSPGTAGRGQRLNLRGKDTARGEDSAVLGKRDWERRGRGRM